MYINSLVAVAWISKVGKFVHFQLLATGQHFQKMAIIPIYCNLQKQHVEIDSIQYISFLLPASSSFISDPQAEDLHSADWLSIFESGSLWQQWIGHGGPHRRHRAWNSISSITKCLRWFPFPFYFIPSCVCVVIVVVFVSKSMGIILNHVSLLLLFLIRHTSNLWI